MASVLSASRLRTLSRVVLWLVSITLLVTALLRALAGDGYEAAIALGALAGIWLAWLLVRRSVAESWQSILQTALTLLVFEAAFCGSILGFYITVPGFDKLNHGLFGAMLALLAIPVFFWLNPAQRNQLTIRPGFLALFCVAFAISGKIGWEFYEFSADRLLQTNMQVWQQDGVAGLTDTMLDLTAGLCGAILSSCLACRRLRQDPRRIFHD